MADWAAGIQLGPYTLVSPLGAGGMGEVWKARDTRLSRIVAIKRLSSPYSDRFDQEVRAIAALNHPHICQIHDVGQGYFILEYIAGKRLQGPLPTDQALRLAIQIAGALEHAHGCGILHRDLKPANVMVTPAALTHVPGLMVIARTSAFAFKGKNEDIRRIAETLGVAHARRERPSRG
jgi:serine/threonine protein kinase